MNQIIVQFIPKNASSVFLSCEVAQTIAEKNHGLMYRSSVHPDEGLFFSFRFSWYRVFWMKNVLVPLDIIFINNKHQITCIFESSVDVGIFNRKFWAAGSCKYVVECNRGFCAKNQILKGTKVLLREK